jgi:hypothetical protein
MNRLFIKFSFGLFLFFCSTNQVVGEDVPLSEIFAMALDLCEIQDIEWVFDGMFDMLYQRAKNNEPLFDKEEYEIATKTSI